METGSGLVMTSLCWPENKGCLWIPLSLSCFFSEHPRSREGSMTDGLISFIQPPTLNGLTDVYDDTKLVSGWRHFYLMVHALEHLSHVCNFWKAVEVKLIRSEHFFSPHSFNTDTVNSLTSSQTGGRMLGVDAATRWLKAAIDFIFSPRPLKQRSVIECFSSLKY